MKKLTILSIAIAASLMTQGVFAHGHGGNQGMGTQPTCEQLINSPQHQARVAETLAYFDLNKDDQITQDEVQASHQARFTELDTDTNGYLSLSEFQAGAPGATTTTTTTTTTTDAQTRGGRGHRGGHPIANDAVMTKFQQSRFTRLDTNSDGQISLAEFTVNLPAFDKFDTDGDGVVTKDDLLKGACPSTTSSTTTTTTTDAATTTTADTITVTTPTVPVEESVVVEEPVVTDTTTTVTEPTTTVTQPTTTTTTKTTTNDHSGGLPCSNCH